MNSQHKAIQEECQREGFEAYVKRIPLGENPYARATKPFDWWRKGWTNAQSYEKPRPA